MASTLGLKKHPTPKRASASASVATEVGRVVLQTMSANGLSRVLSSRQLKDADALLRKVHTPRGRKMAVAALSKVKSPLYSVRRDSRTGQLVIEKGRVKSGEFIAGR